jgi:hypothetical protein
VSHSVVADRNFIERKGFTIHCLHLNSQIKKGIMHVVDERWVTVVVHMNSIHIMNAKGLHFLKFKIKSTKVPILD